MRHARTAGFLGGALGAVIAASCGVRDIGSPVTATIPEGGPAPVGATIDVPWGHPRSPYDGAKGADVPRVAVTSGFVDQRGDVQQLMFAAGEMQISGEPFAHGFAGRNLGNYDRTYIPPDQYIENNGGDDMLPITDLFGFSTAVESYEYSKYHMNIVSQQTGAG